MLVLQEVVKITSNTGDRWQQNVASRHLSSIPYDTCSPGNPEQRNQNTDVKFDTIYNDDAVE